MRTDLSEYLNPLPERPTVIETLVRQIVSLISQAALQPGDRLPSERDIIGATHASRPSVREALRALKTIGVIETRSGQGSFLRNVEFADFLRPELISLVLLGEDVMDMMEARKVLESHVARLAASCTPDELAPLDDVMRRMRAQVDSSGDMYEITWAFHMTLADIAGNRVMAKLVRLLYDMISEVSLKLYWPNVDPREELESHEKVYKGVLKGPEDAESAMRKHLEHVACVLQRAIKADPALAGHRLA